MQICKYAIKKIGPIGWFSPNSIFAPDRGEKKIKKNVKYRLEITIRHIYIIYMYTGMYFWYPVPGVRCTFIIFT